MKQPHSIYQAIRLGLVPQRLMSEALEILEAIDRRYFPHPPTWALPARSLYNDPGWDNVIRAMEEDR